MKKSLSTAYAVFNLIVLIAGFLLVFLFALQAGVAETVECVCGLIVGVVFSPIIHELGHVSLAQAMNMDYVCVKMFCFRIFLKEGKKRFSFASPFSPDETQVIPKTGGDMQKRAQAYTLGGLIFGGIFLTVLLTGAIVCTAFGATRYALWGAVPYAAYLFLLNVAPLEYAGGKTDMLVYVGLKKGFDAEKNMLAAMDIQGQLYEGKSYAEIEPKRYFELPQLCEDEPLFALMLDLRYRYYLEKGELEKAADQLNRLANSQVYLPDSEAEKIAAELVYMHSLLGDFEAAEENGKLCREYLNSEAAAAKRILAAYSAAFGRKDAAEELISQAEEALRNERIVGVAKFERVLLSRIQTA